MKFLKNRTVLGVVCIALSLIICFAITPLFNTSKSSTMKIVRIKNDLKIGQEISSKDIEVVEVGAYNMPSEVVQKSEDVVGKYAASEMIKGEYVLAAKISDSPASENAYLYGLTGEKRAISITIPSFAGGLSGKLISGDIVSVIAVDYKEKGETIVPDELQYVEVIAVTDKKGNDDETTTLKPDGSEENELVRKAIEFYLGHLKAQDNVEYLAPAIKKLVTAAVVYLWEWHYTKLRESV